MFLEDRSGDRIMGRAPSRDPSCPEGFLCEVGSCAAAVAVACPGPVQTCFDFEGIPACGSAWLQWCALNPDTFEGVGCAGGVCCHGNCYAPGTVCCNNANNQCDLGEACNACPPGQSCGSNGCIDPDETTVSATVAPTTVAPTTVAPTTASPTSVAPTSTGIAPTSTSKAQTSTSIAPTSTVVSTTARSSTTSSVTVPASPTPVLAYGPFQVRGCFADSPASRLIPQQALYDFGDPPMSGNGGMTVEKCLELADSFRYAGVEFSGECYWGDFLSATPQQVADQECAMPCAGDTAELCGGDGGLVGYEDPAWIELSRQQLSDALGWYLDVLAQLREAVQEWEDALERLIEQQTGQPPERRDMGARLAMEKRQLEPLVAAVQAANARVVQLANQFSTSFYFRNPRFHTFCSAPQSTSLGCFRYSKMAANHRRTEEVKAQVERWMKRYQRSPDAVSHVLCTMEHNSYPP